MFGADSSGGSHDDGVVWFDDGYPASELDECKSVCGIIRLSSESALLLL